MPSISTSTPADNLLEDALRRNRQGCQPQSLYYCWKSDLRNPELVRKFRKLVAPSYLRPIVFYLFGVIDEPDSWVMSEDDYFEYLMWIKSRDNNIPVTVQNAWKQNPLLFLGFKLSDWNFRVLYRSILNEDRLREIGIRPKYHSVRCRFNPATITCARKARGISSNRPSRPLLRPVLGQRRELPLPAVA